MDTNEQKIKNARAAIERSQADKLSQGIGVSRAEYQQTTAALRREVEQLRNAPLSTTAQSNSTGKAIAVLQKRIDERERELASGLLENGFAETDMARQRQKELSEYRSAQELVARMNNQLTEKQAQIQAVVDQSISIGFAGLSLAMKHMAVQRLMNNDNLTEDEHGKHCTFNGGDIAGNIRATMNDGKVIFSRYSGDVSDGE